MTHPLTGDPDEVVWLCRRIAQLETAITARRQALDELGDLLARVRPGQRVPTTLLASMRLVVDEINLLHSQRDWSEEYLREIATVADTVSVRVVSETQPHPEGTDPA